jgi:hypothetical protein
MKHRAPWLLVLFLGGAIAPSTACSSDADIEELPNNKSITQTAPPVGRQSARMTVMQLERSLKTALRSSAEDSLSWEIEYGNQRIDLFAALGSSLGTPDYIRVTDEPAVPNALYVKFIHDMAANMCRQVAEADAKQTSADKRVLARHVERDAEATDGNFDKNLDYLHLRFFGDGISEQDSESKAALTTLFSEAVAASKKSGSTTTAALDGWKAVCHAMLTSPSFHIY